ncbi:MAG: hypothetical protein ACXVZX_14815 [Terriglobales bacterium]
MTTKQVLLFLAALSFALCGATIAFASPGTSMKADQVNDTRWQNGWTNLMNDVEQSFTPSMPRLLGVEVELVVGNPGPPEDELALTVLDAKGHTLAVVTEPVQTSGCEHTMFIFPKDGIQVTPGETYWVRLKGGTLFGWKYVAGGYEKGAATFNGKPLLKQARSTFLFRTFGAD